MVLPVEEACVPSGEVIRGTYGAKVLIAEVPASLVSKHLHSSKLGPLANHRDRLEVFFLEVK